MASHGRRHPVATMNDLPVPQGDFFARHAANQRRYNTILATGILSFTSALYIVRIFDNNLAHNF